ncbi:NAD-binding domain 4 protein [Aspergillus ellipticus CBS 707.79]|uniref:Fatty acyl-CoA reductase n=1 Tax=Aspergillus ellipticus CBS 707.79 TaxID=1448320 RepID=A0A319CVM2_9EURO|nr:NAD-binding domain 4 protein [Aspergillus ellipticus CBS 707.79]
MPPPSAPNQPPLHKTSYSHPYETHTVLLTGSTGSLGSVLLYKLTQQLPTHKIYLLIRSSPATAETKWLKTMPTQAPAILSTPALHFVTGDMRKEDFGIEPPTLQTLQDEVTLIIHAAAKIKLDADVVEAVENNCLPALELARMAGRFRRLKLFVQVSTAYVNSFMPDGWVGERLYTLQHYLSRSHSASNSSTSASEPDAPAPADTDTDTDTDADPEEELTTLLHTKSSPHTANFSSTYTQAKYLMERLLLTRHPLLPLLLLRPTIFGPAVRDPYPLYGPEDSTPLRKFATLYFSDPGSTQIWHAAAGYKTGTNVLDEIPVDFVANACLIHAAAGTKGIVHVGSQLYVPMTFDGMLEIIRRNVPREVWGELPRVVFVEDRDAPQSILAEVVKVGTRNWVFDCGRSYWIKGLGGPLGVGACGHDAERLNGERVREAWERVRRREGKL